MQTACWGHKAPFSPRDYCHCPVSLRSPQPERLSEERGSEAQKKPRSARTSLRGARGEASEALPWPSWSSCDARQDRTSSAVQCCSASSVSESSCVSSGSSSSLCFKARSFMQGLGCATFA